MFAKHYLRRKDLSRGVLALLLLIGVLVCGAPAFAQTPSPETPVPAEAVTAPVQGSGPSVQAQAAYRQGREAQERHDTEGARRHFQDATRIDPTFPDPYFAIASSYMPFNPGAAGTAFFDGLRAQWSTFRGQHRLVLNVFLFLLAVLVGSMVATATLIGLKGLQHFQHPIAEVIRRKIPGGAAALVAWVLVIQPVLWGMGLYLTLALALGLLWAYLNSGERKIIIGYLALAAVVPFAFQGLSRLSSPFNPDSIPYLMSAASETPDQPGLSESLTRVVAANPSDPQPHLALGLVAEKKGDMTTAEAEYRRALELGGSPGRAGNNLGNVFLHTGRIDLAVDQYKKAAAAEPGLAAPHFNLSQAYARRLQFDLVDQEMRLASQLDFEGMRAALGSNNTAVKHLMSLGASPKELWQSTFDANVATALGVPKKLSWVYDGSLVMLPFFTLLLFAVGFVVGGRIHQFLPTYCCSNCGTVVCRKCLRRIRRRAYCVNCGDTILSLKTSEFTRMLLDKRLRDEAWPRKVAHFLLIMVIPGWEAVRRGRAMVGFAIITIFMVLTVPFLVNGMPVKAVPSIVDVPSLSRWLYFGCGLVLLYGLSALILKALPEPESALMEAELGMMPNSRPDRLDRAA